MSGMSGFGVVCLYSENRAKAPAGGKGRRGMAGQGKSGEKKTMRDILSAFLRMPAPESALEERALLLAQARGAPLDLYEAVVLTQIAKAMKGDTSAAASLSSMCTKFFVKNTGSCLHSSTVFSRSICGVMPMPPFRAVSRAGGRALPRRNKRPPALSFS